MLLVPPHSLYAMGTQELSERDHVPLCGPSPQVGTPAARLSQEGSGGTSAGTEPVTGRTGFFQVVEKNRDFLPLLCILSHQPGLRPGRSASAKCRLVEPVLITAVMWTMSFVLPRDRSHCPADTQHGQCVRDFVSFYLPWPETPFLSTSKQHRVQRGTFTEPTDVKCSNPGTIELKGKVSPVFSKDPSLLCTRADG